MDTRTLGKLKEAEGALRRAGQELRSAWKLLKHNEMEPTAKELADTVLDVETSADQLRDFVAGMAANVQIEGQPASGLSRSNAWLGSAKGEKNESARFIDRTSKRGY